jgi:hypothetical protein
MKPHPLLLFTALLLSWAGALPAGAATLTVGASADAALFEYRPDHNQGGMLDVPAGSLGSENGNSARCRALYKFDLTGQIPPGAIIESVMLTLYANVQPPAAAASDYYLHRVLVDWGEGTGIGNQGTQATLGEVTWNSRAHDLTPWFEPGGAAGTDYASTGSASQFVGSAQTFHQWGSTAGMVVDVQHWLQNPSENFGWILISDSEGTPYTAKRFATREYPTTNEHPRLVIHYTLPTTAAPEITNVFSTGPNFSFSFLAEAGAAYSVEKLLNLSTTNWTLFTNVPAPASDTNVIVSDSLAGSNSFYRVRRD